MPATSTLAHEQPHKVIDYSKWDLMLDEDERNERQYRDVRDRHQESIAVISQWIRSTSPAIKASELRRLLDFITIQHRGIHATNAARAAEICAFLEKLAPGEQLDINQLIELVRFTQKHTTHEEEAERNRAMLVMNVAMGALNTLAAVQEVGKPHWLFDMLHKDPHGAVMKKYAEFGYAMDALAKRPSDPRVQDLPVDMKR